MSIFNKIIEAEHADDYRLGIPAKDAAHFLRRMTAMDNMRGGNGFIKPPKELRKDAQGMTRGERKRVLRAATNAKVSENRDPEFMHSVARRRAAV